MYETDTPNPTTLALAKAMLADGGKVMMAYGGSVSDPAIQQTKRIFQEEEVIDADTATTGDQANAPGMDEQVSPMSAAIMGAIVSAVIGVPNIMSLANVYNFLTEEEEEAHMAPVDPLTGEIDEINLTEQEMTDMGFFSEQAVAEAPGKGAEEEISISNPESGGEDTGVGNPGGGVGPDSEAVGDPDSDSGEASPSASGDDEGGPF